MDPNQDKRLSRQFTQAVTASDLEEVNQLDSRPSTPLSFMEEREKSDEQAVRDIADPVGMKAMFLAAIDKDQDHDGADSSSMRSFSSQEDLLDNELYDLPPEASNEQPEPQESELTTVSTADHHGEIPEINVNSAPIDIEEELITTQSRDIEPGDQVEASPQDETIIDIDYDADNESGDEMDTTVVAAQGAQPSVDTGAIGTMHILNGELNQAVAETSNEVLEVMSALRRFGQEYNDNDSDGEFNLATHGVELLTDNQEHEVDGAEEIIFGIWKSLQCKSSIAVYQCDDFQKQFFSIVASHKHCSVCQANKLPHLPFITPVEVFKVTSAGGVYRDDSLGISITVPEGAVPEFTIFPIEIGTCLYGPFQFAEGSTLISPILMLCPQKNIPLKKPITVTLPHLLTEATKSDIESFNIRVVKADHESLLFFDFDVKKCLFEDINLCESRISFDNRNSITFSVSHFCFLSVLGDLKMNAQKIGYCVYPLIRRDMNVISYRLCVTFLMAPFIKEFVKQFSKHGYEVLQCLSPKSISFKHKQSNIKAYIEKGISQPGWLVCLSYTDYGDVQVISAESVLDVLEKEASAVETDIQLLMYPPSIQINANGQQATAPANVKVHFKTSESKEFCWTLPLDLAPSEAVLGERTSLEQPLTLDLLLSKYTLDLHIKKRIKPEDRAILAQKFHYKKTLCFVDYIGLNASRQSDVSTAQHQFGAAAAMTTALELWSSMNPYRATFKNLLLYLLEQTEGEIAEAVCDYLFKQANKVYADPSLITQLYKLS